MKKTIEIKSASDVVCPWCFVGKRQLTQAMELLKDEYHFEITYLPFELSPGISAEGVNFKQHITEKFGDFEQFIARTSMLHERGAALAIDFQIAKIEVSPNTFPLHMIIQYAHQFGLQSAVTEAFFKAYFEDLIDLSKTENVIAIAKSAGLDEELIPAALHSEALASQTKDLQDKVLALGITGVPFYIIDNQYGLSGAVPVAELVAAIRQV
jgi:predicted DsbA family dithiol-disulfide isomerase